MTPRISRLVHGSPWAGAGGKWLLFGVLLLVGPLAPPQAWHWATGHPLPMLAGMAVSLGVYLPTVIVLWHLDRRQRAPAGLALLVVCSVIVLFGPLAGSINDPLRGKLPLFAFVGLNEELCKVAPVLLLAILVPRAVNGMRDGRVHGALGGLGFAIVEFGYYVAYAGYDEVGWAALANQLGRANALGTHNHVLWSATLGAAIGWAASARRGLRRFALPLLAYLGVALTHRIENAGGNAASAMLGGMLLEPWLLRSATPEATMNAHMTAIQVFFGTVNIVMINLIVAPVLFVVLRRSGETERRIVREQLAAEAPQVATPQEMRGVLADRRWRTRKIDGLDARTGRALVQLQNELAFHRDFVVRHAGDPDTDTPVLAIRDAIGRPRAGATQR